MVNGDVFAHMSIAYSPCFRDYHLLAESRCPVNQVREKRWIVGIHKHLWQGMMSI